MAYGEFLFDSHLDQGQGLNAYFSLAPIFSTPPIWSNMFPWRCDLSIMILTDDLESHLSIVF